MVLDPLRIYKVLKQIDYLKRFRSKLDPLRIYKVLKLLMFFVDKQTGLTLYEFTRFSNCLELLSHEISLDPLRIYKVLKPCGLLERFSFCLTLYEFTRFSNLKWSSPNLLCLVCSINSKVFLNQAHVLINNIALITCSVQRFRSLNKQQIYLMIHTAFH